MMAKDIRYTPPQAAYKADQNLADGSIDYKGLVGVSHQAVGATQQAGVTFPNPISDIQSIQFLGSSIQHWGVVLTKQAIANIDGSDIAGSIVPEDLVFPFPGGDGVTNYGPNINLRMGVKPNTYVGLVFFTFGGDTGDLTGSCMIERRESDEGAILETAQI